MFPETERIKVTTLNMYRSKAWLVRTILRGKMKRLEFLDGCR